MLSLDVHFIKSGRDPECRVAIDRIFPRFYGIQLMTGGTLSFQRGNRPRHHVAGTCFFWTDRRSRYQYAPGPGGFWNHHWIALGGRLLDEYYRPLLEQLAPDGVLPLTRGRAIPGAFDALVTAAQSASHPADIIHALNQLLALIALDASGRHPELDGLARIKAAVDAEPGAVHDFAALARREGFSYTNFRRLFRRRYQEPPHRYLLGRRLQEAASRLTDSAESVQCIGFDLGYDDPARFSRAFKARYGCSPLRFRQAARLFETMSEAKSPARPRM